MNTLGIYFGPQLVSIVETKGSKPVNNLQISQVVVSAGESPQEKVPYSVKLANLLKEQLTQSNIAANEAVVSISGKDLIVRTFEMPILPRQELNTAVNFEIRKYIPFKIEELISDFQFKVDKNIQKTCVLFVGIKKEALDNYISILSQLGIKIKSIEYSAFSILRLIRLAGFKEKGIMGLVNIDLAKDDEANFVVLDDGFPLFSRDISLIGEEESVKTQDASKGVSLDKLKREIQMSIDYYDRKFPGRRIGKMLFIANPNYRAELEEFGRELSLGAKESGMNINFIDINKYTDKPIPFSLSFVKGYSSSLSGAFDTAVKIDLLLAKDKAAKRKAAAVSLPGVKRFKSNIIVGAVCFSVFIFILLSGVFRELPLQSELRSIVDIRPKATTVSGELSYKELITLNFNYKVKIESIGNIIKNRLYLTPLLDAIPRVVPKGMRLVKLSFKAEDKTELTLAGRIYLGDSNAESELINAFVATLKENAVFTKYFEEISLISIQLIQERGISLTDFIISCQGMKKDGAKR